MRFIRVRNILCLAGVLVLSSCSTSNQFAIAQYDSNGDIMPPISLYRGDRTTEEAACAKYSEGLLKYCSFDAINLNLIGSEFRATKLFESVRIARPDPSYKIYLTQIFYDTEEIRELSNAVLSGATLFLTPMNIDAKIQVVARITHDTEEIATLTYLLPFTQTISLFSTGDIETDLARSIVSHIVSDIQKQELIQH